MPIRGKTKKCQYVQNEGENNKRRNQCVVYRMAGERQPFQRIKLILKENWHADRGRARVKNPVGKFVGLPVEVL